MSTPGPAPWVTEYWWLLTLIGGGLLVGGLLTTSDPARYGGPVSFGAVMLIAGLLGAARKLRERNSESRHDS
jgi:uncharacterized membrane protein HdeD (DUF308 family)